MTTMDALLGTGYCASNLANSLLSPETVKVCILAFIGTEVIGCIERIRAAGVASNPLSDVIQCFGVEAS
jgi:hypothetical protein